MRRRKPARRSRTRRSARSVWRRPSRPRPVNRRLPRVARRRTRPTRPAAVGLASARVPVSQASAAGASSVAGVTPTPIARKPIASATRAARGQRAPSAPKPATASAGSVSTSPASPAPAACSSALPAKPAASVVAHKPHARWQAGWAASLIRPCALRLAGARAIPRTSPRAPAVRTWIASSIPRRGTTPAPRGEPGCREHAKRQLLRASQALATVRRLLRPVQVDIGQNQINGAGSVVARHETIIAPFPDRGMPGNKRDWWDDPDDGAQHGAHEDAVGYRLMAWPRALWLGMALRQALAQAAIPLAGRTQRR